MKRLIPWLEVIGKTVAGVTAVSCNEDDESIRSVAIAFTDDTWTLLDAENPGYDEAPYINFNPETTPFNCGLNIHNLTHIGVLTGAEEVEHNAEKIRLQEQTEANYKRSRETRERMEYERLSKIYGAVEGRPL